MLKPLVVGLCGYAQSGKDTLAALLVEQRGYERRAFADNMREMLLRINPLVLGNPTEGAFHPTRLKRLVETHGWEQAKKIDEVRSLLQRLGTEAGRGILGDNVWVDALFAQPIHSPIVISDVRFPNEAERIHQEGGFVVRIIRDGVTPPNSHISETAYSDQDFIIHNNSTPQAMVDSYELCLNRWFNEYGSETI